MVQLHGRGREPIVGAAGWLSADTHPPPDTGHRLGSELGQQVNSEASEPGALRWVPWAGASLPVPLSRESLSSLSSLSNVLLEDETLEAEQLSRSFTASFCRSFSLREARSSCSGSRARSTSLSAPALAGASSWPASSATCPTSASTSASGSGPGSPALAGGDNRGDYSEDGNFEATSSEREWKGDQTWGRQNLKVALDSRCLVIQSNTAGKGMAAGIHVSSCSTLQYRDLSGGSDPTWWAF